MPDDNIKWQEVLKNAVRGDSIRASELRKVPHLKSCPRWDEAQFLGRVDYHLQFAHYDGGLVKYGDRLYYVSSAQIDALRPWVRWRTDRTITVVDG